MTSASGGRPPTTTKTNASWQYLRRIAILLNNRAVDAWFAERQRLRGRPLARLHAAIRINTKDSAPLSLVRMLLFHVFIKGNESASAVAAVPEWFQTKFGPNLPQLVVIYKAKKPNGSWTGGPYPLTIPHWNRSRQATETFPFPRYQKGNHSLTVQFADNSKVSINASSQRQCKFVWDAIAPGTSGKQPRFTYFLRPDTRNRVLVYPQKAVFFGKGKTEPTWEVRLDHRDQSPRRQ